MMKKLSILVLLLSICSVSFAQSEEVKADSVSSSKTEKAKKAPKQKKQKAEEVDEVFLGKVAGQIYVFGCSSEFGDSTIYFTDVLMIDSLTVTKKYKFLPYRSDFSQQLKDKLEGNSYNMKNQTTCVFFSEKKSKLQKQYAKLKKRYLTKHKMNIINLDADKFKFVHPLDYYPEK